MFCASISHNGSGGVPGDRGAPLSFFPKGTLTHHRPRAGGGTAALRQTRALRGGLRSLRRAPANTAGTAVPVIIGCAKGSVRRSLRLRKPATGSFIAEAGRIKKDRPAFSLPQRETEKENRGGKNDWQSIIWKRRSSAEAQAVPLAQPRPI